MRALNPTRAFDDRRSEHARFAEQLERDARPDDIDDRIHRADFVKVNFLRRVTVDFSFRDSDAVEDGDGFLFHPGGQGAGGDELFDVGERAAVFVVRDLPADRQAGA